MQLSDWGILRVARLSCAAAWASEAAWDSPDVHKSPATRLRPRGPCLPGLRRAVLSAQRAARLAPASKLLQAPEGPLQGTLRAALQEQAEPVERTPVSFRPSRQPEGPSSLAGGRQPLRVRTRPSAGFLEGPSSPRDVQVRALPPCLGGAVA